MGITDTINKFEFVILSLFSSILLVRIYFVLFYKILVYSG